MKFHLRLHGVIYFVVLFLLHNSNAEAATHIFSDTEGSMSAIEALVEHGKLKWSGEGSQKRLEFVSPKDNAIFLGDLSGPNWMDSNHPQNMQIRETLSSFKDRYPERVDLILGNHEYNRLGFIRDNQLMARGEHPEYKGWLQKEGVTDSIESRVSFWGKNTYGVTKDGVALPLDQYQKELSNSLGRKVSTAEAAEVFAKDLEVGVNGKPNGKMLDYILKGQEAVVRNGYAFTHAPISSDVLGVIPKQATKMSAGASWLEKRNREFFRPELKKFVAEIRAGKVPSPILPNLGDARWDSAAKTVVSDSSSLSYTERPREGDQYRGVYKKVAKAFLEDHDTPVKGLFSGYKPAGNYQTVHRVDVDGRSFLDTVADVSRGPEGKLSTLTVNDGGNIELTHRTPEGKLQVTEVGPGKNRFIGMVTEDGFQVKQGPFNGEYILERYKGFSLETQKLTDAQLRSAKLKFSNGDAATDTVLQGKIMNLKKAITDGGGKIVDGTGEAARVVGDRFVLDMRGASDWAALPTEKVKGIKKDLENLAGKMNPEEVVILTGGNRAQNPNAFETAVHDTFAGDTAKKKFDIIGFMKHDTPADEVDKAVKYVMLIGQGDNWDGPVQAALRFAEERSGASMMIGGGGVLKRSADSDIAARMKDRMFFVTGYGGASEEKAAKGVAVASIDEFMSKLRKLTPESFRPSAPLKKDGPHLQFANDLNKKGDVETFREMMKLYPELEMLKGDVAASPSLAKASSNAEVMSQKLFGAKHPEFDRTALAILNIKWAMQNKYDAMTSPQTGANKLSQESFNDLKKYTSSILKDAEHVDAMMTYMAIHDLGKVKSFEEKARSLGIKSVDHDRILNEVIEKRPDLLPSYSRLSPKYQKMIKEGLAADFNMGQFMQGENVAASLAKLKTLSPDARDFYMYHVLMDIGGVTGHVNTRGSVLLNEKIYQNFRIAQESLAGLSKGKSVEDVYADYLIKQGSRLGIATDTPFGKAAVRVSLMSGANDKISAKKAESALKGLAEPLRISLVTDLNKMGGLAEKATLVYYAPALLSNSAKIGAELKPIGGFEEGLQNGLKTLANVYAEAAKSTVTSGVVTVNVKALADEAAAGKAAEMAASKVAIGFENANEGMAAVQRVKDVTPKSAAEFFKARDKKVVTLVGYSALDYQDKAKVVEAAREQLKKFDPKKTIINIGATSEGIGEVYRVAKEMGFETSGIVSSQAKKDGGLSSYVDNVLFVDDPAWGGFKPGTNELTPTSKAMVGASDHLIAFGGGEVGRDELIAAKRIGKTVDFFTAEMNHKIATERAVKKGQPIPVDFSGPANTVFNPATKSPAEIEALFKAKNKKVVTFIGYSGAGYQNKAKMLADAKAALSKLDPKSSIVNIGATSEGIGEVYKLAKEMGFETTGIVSSQAKKYGGLSPYVDHPLYVDDPTWGGFKPGTKELSPTSKAMVGVSDEIIAIGGGEVGRDEVLAARELRKKVSFIPADMDHDLATKKALSKGQPIPTDFSGATHDGVLKAPKGSLVKIEAPKPIGGTAKQSVNVKCVNSALESLLAASAK
jgi:hypothetical protein